MTHHFDSELAEKYGLNSAIILSNLQFWIVKNRANKKHFIDGRTWTYNSVSAFSELFPYLTKKQVRTALQILIDSDVLITANHNENGYDRSLWYAFKDEDLFLPQQNKTICPERQIEKPQRANRKATEGKSIPYINTDIKPENTAKPKTAPHLFIDSIVYLNSQKDNKEYYYKMMGSDYEKFDLDGYFEDALNWSESKGAKKVNWISTIKNFIRSDIKKGNPQMRKEKAQLKKLNFD